MKSFRLFWLILSVGFAGSIAGRGAAPEKVADGILVPLGDRTLKIQVCAEDIIRVAEGRDRAFFERSSLSVLPRHSRPRWNWEATETQASIRTAKLAVRVDLATGAMAQRSASCSGSLHSKHAEAYDWQYSQ